LVPKTIVGDVCFIRKDRKVLLLRRSKKPLKGRWTGVGGKTKFFEEPMESCLREVKEETGLDIEPKLAGIITTINKAEGSKWILFVYVADGYRGELKQSREGILEWVDEEKLYEKDLAFIRASLPYILCRERKGIITGKIIHDGREVLGCTFRDEEKVLFKMPDE